MGWVYGKTVAHMQMQARQIFMKNWVYIKNGKLVILRYMSDCLEMEMLPHIQTCHFSLEREWVFYGRPLLNVDFGWSSLSYSQLEESPLQYVPFVCMLAFSDCSWRLGKCVEKPVTLLPYDQIVSSLCVHVVFQSLSLNLGLLSFLHISLPILK